MRRTGVLRNALDFDAWAYHVHWPQTRRHLPLFPHASLAVEDIKFAYNAWSLLRLAMFFGTGHPKILSNMTNTTPSMDLQYGGNRLFFMHANVAQPLSPSRLKVALTPCHPNAVCIQQFQWASELAKSATESRDGVEIVLGMENGLSEAVTNACDRHVFIPQYGSIGSLSMLCALAIATHLAASSFAATDGGVHAPTEAAMPVPELGHMPLSAATSQEKGTRPHEADMLHMSNTDIKQLLAARRERYPLQIAVVMHNELADRNIGAVMRNANAFNCEKLILVNRRKFNRRGAVGTHHLLDMHHCDTVHDASFAAHTAEYDMWLVYPYYPYLKVYGDEANSTGAAAGTFLRPTDPRLAEWLSTNHSLTEGHLLCQSHPHLLGSGVFLDDPASLQRAVRQVALRGKKGILLVVPEEGTTVVPQLAALCSRVLFNTHPSRLALEVQRGLNPALATAVALERLRTMIDSLSQR